MKINEQSYRNLINKDIQWLRQNTPTGIERAHIITVLKESITFYYPEENNTKHGMDR